MEIKLQYPFTTPAGQKIDTINTRRLKVRDLKSIGEQAGGKESELELLGIARMCNLVPEDLEEMDAADYQKLKARFLDVLGITGHADAGRGSAGEVVPVSAE